VASNYEARRFESNPGFAEQTTPTGLPVPSGVPENTRLWVVFYCGAAPRLYHEAVIDPRRTRFPQDRDSVLSSLELHEENGVCDSNVIVRQTGLDRSTVDMVLGHLWRGKRIDCLGGGRSGLAPIMSKIRRLTKQTDRRLGERARYKGWFDKRDPA
jgi:hypothetical protein